MRSVADNRFVCRLAVVCACAALASGCHPQHTQSMLHPESAEAAQIAWLWWFLFAVCGVVFVIVMVLTGVAVLRNRQAAEAGEQVEARTESPVGNGFILIGGAIIPAVILVVILYASVKVQVALRQPEPALTIRIVGHQFWWDVYYPDEQIRTANEIHIPVGEVVRLEMHSADVIHSLWIPNLQGKTDLMPDMVTTMWLRASRPGVFQGQCAEYCGVQHALMRLRVVALPREEFDAWVEGRLQADRQPRTELQRRGLAVFFDAKCHNCHAIRDTFAVGLRGPDLTHIGSRLTLGAGVIPNNRGNLAGWIANPQPIKPGNLMSATYLEPEELHALVEYLQSLD